MFYNDGFEMDENLRVKECPKCGNVCETEGEPVIGQHLQCPYCAEKFPYSGGSQSNVDMHPQLEGVGDATEMTARLSMRLMARENNLWQSNMQRLVITI